MPDLGVTEKHVVDKIRSHIKDGIESCDEIRAELEKLYDINWELAIVDPEYKESVTMLVDPLDKIVDGLSKNGLFISMFVTVYSRKFGNGSED